MKRNKLIITSFLFSFVIYTTAWCKFNQWEFNNLYNIYDLNQDMYNLYQELESICRDIDKIIQEFNQLSKDKLCRQVSFRLDQPEFSLKVKKSDQPKSFVTVDQSSEESFVKIICNKVGDEKIEATIKESFLEIKMPTTQISIKYKDPWLSVITTQEEKEIKDKEYYFYRRDGSTHFIKQQLDFEKATIDYEKDTKTLTVTMPVATKEKETEKIVPVTIK